MDEPGFMGSTRVAVLGLGLMGGSLALALRGRCRALLGIDPDPAVLSLAAEMELADQLSASAPDLLAQADLVILATPVHTILRLLEDLPGLHPGRAVVLDLGSTKAEVVRAMQRLPERFDPLGGHPMCGKEHSSLALAEAALFCGAPFALTPCERTSDHARRLAEELVTLLGSHPLWLSAETHDRWVTATSQLPYLIANALLAVTPAEAAPLIGPGFRSTSRTGATSPQVMADALATNRPNALEALRGFRRRLDLLEAQLAGADQAGLLATLEQGAAARRTLLDLADHGETTCN
ncbi:MAG: prephenate dehydrogenase/arogenate dehydrogenase family protein [Anaerolineaceae bacterium]|nr:prephenate dehydrogenase/arogenate dehydrogenase family protein [Anaerolineaceae bacterium]